MNNALRPARYRDLVRNQVVERGRDSPAAHYRGAVGRRTGMDHAVLTLFRVPLGSAKGNSRQSGRDVRQLELH